VIARPLEAALYGRIKTEAVVVDGEAAKLDKVAEIVDRSDK
jgi:hypothetical protein